MLNAALSSFEDTMTEVVRLAWESANTRYISAAACVMALREIREAHNDVFQRHVDSQPQSLLGFSRIYLSAYPPALVAPPTISTSDYEDTVTNVREYTWNILIVTTTENLPSTDPTYLEGLIDAVLNVFDLDCTLGGTSIAAVMPAVLEPPGPISSNSITYVTFYVTLKARALVNAAVKTN